MKKIFLKIKDLCEEYWYGASRMLSDIKDFINKWYTTLTVKERRDAMMAVVNGYPWDYSYLLRTELTYIKYRREYFKRNHLVESAENTYEKLNWAVKVLQSYLDEDYEGIIELPRDLQNTIQICGIDLPSVGVKCTKYVNFRNMDRFIGNRSDIDLMRDIYKKYPQELYRIKLWNVYCLIRKRYTCTWWD